MNQRYIFIDIDGTLLDPVNGVPESAVIAVREARARGHKVFICTGRSKINVPTAVSEIGFDGYICAAGAYAEAEGEILLLETLEKETVMKLMEPINSRAIGCLFEGYRATFINEPVCAYAKRLYKIDAFLYELLEKYHWATELIPRQEEYFRGSEVISKLSLLTDRLEDLNALYPYLPKHLKLTIHDPNAEGVYLCEIAVKTISKASGIQSILSRYDIHQDQTICYGDSMNDIEMVQFCGTGICMRNGSPALLAVADDFAEPVMEDGIYKSFLKYGLIADE